MKNYLITFVTLDGNEQGVYVSATSKERAILKFESELKREKKVYVLLRFLPSFIFMNFDKIII